MKRALLIAFLFCTVPIANAQKAENDTRAEYHLAFADSLETAGSFQGAALVYKMVAELYPSTIYYANAVRNLGHLYINPFNSARNDSLALFWFTKHLEISWLPRGERTRSVIVASLLRERMQGSSVYVRKDVVIDSLSALVRMQHAELAAQSKKISKLSSDLEQTDNDLQILLEFQKNPTVARRDSLSLNTQKLADAAEIQQVRRRSDSSNQSGQSSQSSEQLQKLRDIDLRALQRRTKR